MGLPRIPSIFRPSSTASPDARRTDPEHTPPHAPPRRPKNRGLGALLDLPRLVRGRRDGASTSMDGPAIGAQPASPPAGFKLPRQNALNAEGIRALERQFPPPSSGPSSGPLLRPSPSGQASASNPLPARTLAEQLLRREQILASQPPAISVASSPPYIPVDALPPPLSKAFLEAFDPIRSLGLTDQSVFYRALASRYLLADGHQMKLAGNPRSGAYVRHHHRLLPSSGLASRETFESLPATARERMLNDPMQQYEWVRMRARDLPEPSLNVMFGVHAEAGARSYAKTSDHVVVSMTFGDLRKAGGQVFLDTRASAGSDHTKALIVTLPEGRTVPVKIIPNGRQEASTSTR
ncbi:AvrPphF family type III effector [Ralstonia pseudosolanacearum]|uniref:AvrPphF family type III effector n=2 Tax=Ralstonia pseudosolanacearum TaxID=1310165 RepID=UPI001E42684F